jgi:hypothetical protein
MTSHIERTSFDNPILPRLSTILDEVQRGVWRVPAFQRPSVWGDEDRRDLLDSIIKGLPIGSFLVWRTSRGDLGAYDKIADVPVMGRENEARATYTWLLDGHQRITTLFGALSKPPGGRSRTSSWNLHYELGCGEDPAVRLPASLPRSGAVPPHYLPLSILRDGKAFLVFRDALYRDGRDDLVDEAVQVQNRFMDYIIPVVPLVSDDLDLVTDAFVRINSRGKQMSEAHMLRALTHLKEHDTGKRFQELRRALPGAWRELPDQCFVNTLKAMHGLDVYRAGVEELSSRLKKNVGAFNDLQRALIAATEVLAGLGVRGPTSLPYMYQLVTLAAVEDRQPGRLASHHDALVRWCWRTGYSALFTGATGAVIQREIDRLAEEVDDHPLAPIGRPATLRGGSIRAAMFRLFLLQAVEGRSCRERREARAGSQAALTRIFPDEPSVPGNLVVAYADEARELRKRLVKGELFDTDADEYVLTAEAVTAMKDGGVDAFVRVRTDVLWTAERALLDRQRLSVVDEVIVEEGEGEDDAE